MSFKAHVSNATEGLSFRCNVRDIQNYTGMKGMRWLSKTLLHIMFTSTLKEVTENILLLLPTEFMLRYFIAYEFGVTTQEVRSRLSGVLALRRHEHSHLSLLLKSNTPWEERTSHRTDTAGS